MRRLSAAVGMATCLALAACMDSPESPLVQFPGAPKGGELVLNPLAPPLEIVYDPMIEPGAFSAKLNGQQVTKLFNPATPFHKERVRLPLTPGRNTLEIEVNSRSAVSSFLLPQSHTLVIRWELLTPTAAVRAEKRTFESQEAADAYLKQRQRELTGR